MESVNSLRISAPQWWPLREGRDGKIEGRNEKCEFLARESVRSSPIVGIFGKGKCEFIANFSATMVTSLPSVSLCISLSLSLSPKVPHAQYRKRFRASYNTFSHITFLGYNHMNSRASVFLNSLLSEHIIRYHMCPWGRLLPSYHTRFSLQRGCCCQGKEVVPVDHIRGKGLSSCLTSWVKIGLIAAFEQCPQGPAPNSFSYRTLSLLNDTLFWALNTCVRCITFFKGPPYLLSSITFFEGPSFLALLTICISRIEQCALVL